MSATQIDETELDYQSAEPWAVIGLVMSWVTPLAMLGSVWMLLPVLGVVFNLIALGRLKRHANHFGRAAALIGLGLSVFSFTAPIVQYGANYLLLSRQALPVADQWFEYLRQGSPEKAFMLKVIPDKRQSFDDSEALWAFFRNDGDVKSKLAEFVNQPLVRTLIKLGDRAHVKYQTTTDVSSEGETGTAFCLYTVTFDDQDGRKTFFVAMALERKPTAKSWLNPWYVRTAFVPATEEEASTSRR